MANEIINRQRRLKLDKPAILRLVGKTLEMEGAAGSASIVYAGRRLMTELNRQYFGKNEPTDVIAFPLQDDLHHEPDYLGEVIVCSDVAVEEAEKRGVDVEHELYLYTVHGILHLLGHTDETPGQRTKMNNRAKSILKTFHRIQHNEE